MRMNGGGVRPIPLRPQRSTLRSELEPPDKAREHPFSRARPESGRPIRCAPAHRAHINPSDYSNPPAKILEPPYPSKIGFRIWTVKFKAVVWILKAPSPLAPPSPLAAQFLYCRACCPLLAPCRCDSGCCFLSSDNGQKGVVSLSGLTRIGPQRSEGQPGWSWKGRLWSPFHGKRKRSIRLSFQIHPFPLFVGLSGTQMLLDKLNT